MDVLALVARAVNVLDLFSGIGGFSLGLERTGGFRTIAFCEIEPYCRAVLRKHWPAVPIFEDVRDLHAFDVGPVDVICGGFPCQDISVAGKGAGLAGERSGLWSEYRRLIGECRPRWAIIENSPALRTRGYDRIKGDLAGMGYACRPFVVGAKDIGANHIRRRAWIVANAFGLELRQQPRRSCRQDGAGTPFVAGDGEAQSLAHAAGSRQIEGRPEEGQSVRDEARRPESEHGWWAVEPDVGRVADGVPARSHRITALGNSVVPQIPELIGRAILETEAVCTP